MSKVDYNFQLLLAVAMGIAFSLALMSLGALVGFLFLIT